MNFCFEHFNKEQIENILPQLFEILYSNMGLKYPTGCTREDDYRFWKDCFISQMKDPARQLVIMISDKTIIGYFHYSIVDDVLKMEELQTKKEYHGSGLFGMFYTWLIKQLPKKITSVEAFTDKRNYKTQSILEHLGLDKCGENKNGICYYYKGDYKKLLERYG